jgi:hypothetical protein
VNRAQLQKLVEVRVGDAAYLLVAQRWEAAYYLLGYAVECALKSCVLRYQHDTGAIFADADYLKIVAGCWTHDVKRLLRLAGLERELGSACGANPALKGHWDVVALWSEGSRYRLPTAAEARALYEAVTDEPNGVLQWIRARW